MPLPVPIQATPDDEKQVKVTIANCTNPHLRHLVIMYESRKSQKTPAEVAQNLWATISWAWQSHRAEAEETIRTHAKVDDIDTWLVAQYESDVAKYKDLPIPEQISTP